jgi:hypothetical protein
MSIKIVANGKIAVKNVKPVTFFDSVLTVMPEISCLELYYEVKLKKNTRYLSQQSMERSN